MYKERDYDLNTPLWLRCASCSVNCLNRASVQHIGLTINGTRSTLRRFVRDQLQATCHGFAKTCIFNAQPLLHWCWKVSVIRAQMELSPTSICECGALDQTAAHMIMELPFHRTLREYHETLIMYDETR